MYLTDTLNNKLARSSFTILLTLSSPESKYGVDDSLINTEYTGAYTIINETLILDVYSKLNIEPLPFSKLKPLRSYNGKLLEKLITHFILPSLTINDYKERLYPILITPLGYYNIILGKPWINKYRVLLNIIRDKILFVLGRCEHDYNKAFSSNNLSFKQPYLLYIEEKPVTNLDIQASNGIDISEIGAIVYY